MPRPALLLAAALLAAACGPDGPDDPPATVMLRERGAVTDTARDCPNLRGSYRVQRNLIWRFAVERAMSEDQRRLWWERVAIRGDAVDSLTLVLGTSDLRDTVRLARGRDYRCAGGWLIPSGEVWLRDLGGEDSARLANDPKHREFTLALAADTRGPIVGRLHVRSWSQFDVWCGDGCRGFPLPWTVRHETIWLELPSDAELPPEPVAAESSRRTAGADRLAELGEQAVRPIPIERMVRAMLPTGGEVLSVEREGAGYRVKVVVPADTDMADFVGRLINTQGMRGAHEQKDAGGWTVGSTRRWQTSVWVPREF